MKKFLKVTIWICILTIAVACNKWDDNGDLGGMWQMTEWRNSDGQFVATKENQIYYSFQLSMFKAQRQDRTPAMTRCASFTNNGKTIVISKPLGPAKDGHESILDMRVMKELGVDADGRFTIELLTEDALVLRRTDQSTLKFRKY